MDLLLVISTFPDEEKARQIGTLLVEKQLAACVNLLPGLTSIYRWQGKIETAGEVMAIFKTTAAGFPAFRDELLALHPYDVPEVVALRTADVSAAYGRWIMEQVGV
ncbi:divalent-cation tolerance protein CutA [Luteolibacter sp. SL250]|uniref:divalent-cation tolerance protein CutA n=1 Tax=Luteolibacter sp. SL250 TaxID=2995170 RepID=UPI00226E7EA4|nr:divalent-cation tolerance protein CutA [Luteolibacter sp. SL250]WAC19347.1 divalent-cation tolerance protein CutA [Luteolibacter sp. SL250]